MNPFKRDEAPFLVDVHKHAGRFRGVHGGTMSCWEVKNTMIEPFSDITKAVCTELGNCRFPRSTVVMFDIFLRGSSPDSAEVYVMLAGATEQHRKKAVKRLRKSSLSKNYPGLKMDHWDWPPDAPQVVMMGSDGDTPSWTTVHRSQGYEIRFSGKAPEGDPMDKLGHISCHIVATDRGSSGDNADDTSTSRKNSNSELLSITNRGASDEKSGVLSHYVMAGGMRYLLAPAHIFLGEEPEETDDFSDIDDSDSDLTSTSDTESSFDVMLRAGSATPPDLESQPASDSATDENPSDRMSVFDSSTNRNGKQPELPSSIVAPAISCARLSSIELDYALIPAPVTLGLDPVGLRCLVETSISAIPFQKESELFSSRTVERFATVTTPSQGLMTGKISTRPVMMRLPYSKTFSMVYPLELASPVKPGDCGSAVLDVLSGVYGFIAAGSTFGNVAYVIPAADILKDIRTRLGWLSARLLPGPKPSATGLPLPTAPAPDTPSPVSARDVFGSRRLQEAINRLAAENEALRANNARLNDDLSIRVLGEAADKKVLETQAVTIKTSEQQIFALEEALRKSNNLARISGEKITDLEIEVARHERHQRREHVSTVPLPPAANDILSAPLRTASPASPPATGNKPGWESPESSSRGVTHSFFKQVVLKADSENLKDANSQLEAANKGLLLENGQLRAELSKLRDDNGRMLVEKMNYLIDDLNQLDLASLSESDLHYRPGERIAEYSASTGGSSVSSSRYSRSSVTSSVGSRRSVATAASSINGSIKSRLVYSEILEHPGATPETFQIGDLTIKGTGLTISEQADPGQRSPKVFPSAAGDSTATGDIYRPAARRAPRRLRPYDHSHVEDWVPDAAPGSSAPSSRLNSQTTSYYVPGPRPKYGTPVPPTGFGPQPLVDLASMPPPPPIDAIASARDPWWGRPMRICDNCQQRKVDCAIENGKDMCLSCSLYAQSCTSTGPDPVESDVPKPSGPAVADRANA